MANELVYFINNANNMCRQIRDTEYYAGWCNVGFYGSPYSKAIDGALRYTNINIAQGTTVNLAKLVYFTEGTVPAHDANIKWKVSGIDEDNTLNFVSSPFDKTKTSSSTSGTWGDPHSGTYGEIDVKDIVNEILGRDGWSSGNAMGFTILDNGTGTDQTRWAQDKGYDLGTGDSYLVIRTSAEPDFTPTPVTVNAPTFPTTGSHGIKIAKPGISVLEATEDQLHFTTRKKVLKVKMEGEVETSEMYVNIPHGLSYKPAFLVYAIDSEKGFYRFKLPRITYYLDGLSDISGFVQSQASNIVVTESNTLLNEAKVYYYIFIDPLEE